MHPILLFLADNLDFIAGLAVGAIGSPLLILGLLHYLDFIAPDAPQRPAPRTPAPHTGGERRRYRPYHPKESQGGAE